MTSEHVTFEPQYEHDCEECTFLGQVNIVKLGDHFDLYVHKYPEHMSGRNHDSFIARFGDAGHEYKSVPDIDSITKQLDGPLAVARILANSLER